MPPLRSRSAGHRPAWAALLGWVLVGAGASACIDARAKPLMSAEPGDRAVTAGADAGADRGSSPDVNGDGIGSPGPAAPPKRPGDAGAEASAGPATDARASTGGGPEDGAPVDGAAPTTPPGSSGPSGSGAAVDLGFTGTGTGVVSFDRGDDRACRAGCRRAFERGSLVTLTALPDPGSVFTGWQGSCAGKEPCSLVLDGDRTVTAVFDLPRAGETIWLVPTPTAYDVAVDGDDTVVVAGNIFGAAVVGTTNLTSAGSADAFVAVFDGNGKSRWVKSWGDKEDDWFDSIVINARHEIVVGGVLRGKPDLGRGPFTSEDGGQGALAKFTAAGALVWVVSALQGNYVFPLPGGGYQVGVHVVENHGEDGTLVPGSAFPVTVLGIAGAQYPDGGLVVAGNVSGTGTIGARRYDAVLSDPAVARFSASGAPLWATVFNGPEHEAAFGVDVDARGDVYACGTFGKTLTIAGERHDSLGDGGAFLVKLSGSDGRLLWKRVLGPTGSGTRGTTVRVDGQTVLWAGASGGPYDLGGAPLEPGPFLARYNLDGGHVWSRVLEGTVYAIKATPAAVWAAGDYLLRLRP